MAYEILVDVFKSCPSLAAEVVVEVLDVPLAPRTGARLTSVDLLERRGDAVVVRLREEKARRFRARMREVRLLHELGAIDAGEVTSRVHAWLAHARHGHTRALCQRVLGELAFGGREEVVPASAEVLEAEEPEAADGGGGD
ncbi:hypothetical protein [Sorangium sp. So ce1024]|uniref:hypothetical protein n=1 Tax=unclassified Sorangium TaxID=2621164 RepID=UPI003F00D13F